MESLGALVMGGGCRGRDWLGGISLDALGRGRGSARAETGLAGLGYAIRRGQVWAVKVRGVVVMASWLT